MQLTVNVSPSEQRKLRSDKDDFDDQPTTSPTRLRSLSPEFVSKQSKPFKNNLKQINFIASSISDSTVSKSKVNWLIIDLTKL